MIFINSRDDPLVPEDLLIPIQNFASKILIYMVVTCLTVTLLSIKK